MRSPQRTTSMSASSPVRVSGRSARAATSRRPRRRRHRRQLPAPWLCRTDRAPRSRKARDRGRQRRGVWRRFRDCARVRPHHRGGHGALRVARAARRSRGAGRGPAPSCATDRSQGRHGHDPHEPPRRCGGRSASRFRQRGRADGRAAGRVPALVRRDPARRATGHPGIERDCHARSRRGEPRGCAAQPAELSGFYRAGATPKTRARDRERSRRNVCRSGAACDRNIAAGNVKADRQGGRKPPRT